MRPSFLSGQVSCRGGGALGILRTRFPGMESRIWTRPEQSITWSPFCLSCRHGAHPSRSHWDGSHRQSPHLGVRKSFQLITTNSGQPDVRSLQVPAGRAGSIISPSPLPCLSPLHPCASPTHSNLPTSSLPDSWSHFRTSVTLWPLKVYFQTDTSPKRRQLPAIRTTCFTALLSGKCM